MNLSTCCLYLFILWEQILKAASDTTEGTQEGRYSYILLLHLQRHLKPFWTKYRLKKITQECELNKNTSKCVSLTHTCTTWALLPCEKNISNAHFCEKKKKSSRGSETVLFDCKESLFFPCVQVRSSLSRVI